MVKGYFTQILFALVLICIGLGLWSCASTGSISTDPNDPNADSFLLAPRFTGLRFEVFPEQMGLIQSNVLWIRQMDANGNGDRIALRWSEISLLTNKKGVTCNFGTPNANCQKCDQCVSNFDTDACRTTFGFLGLTPFQLYTFQGLSSVMMQGVATSPAMTSGCERANGNPSPGVLLSPTSDTTYEVKLDPEFAGNTPVETIIPEAQAKVRVLGSGTMPVTYKLNSLPLTNPPEDLVIFSARAPAFGARLEHNFSNKLSIGRIRVLRGFEQRDPITDDLSIQISGEPLKPSRVFMVVNFDAEHNLGVPADRARCYAVYVAGAGDGDLDLTRCRGDRMNLAASNNLRATPVYLDMHPADVITWFVEFQSDDFESIGGGEMPPALEPGQIMAIEFTVQ